MSPVEEFDANFDDVARDDESTRLGAFSIRAGVLTTTGAKFSTRVEKRLRDHFRSLAKKTSAPTTSRPRSSGR
jgi:hypothetical protein